MRELSLEDVMVLAAESKEEITQAKQAKDYLDGKGNISKEILRQKTIYSSRPDAYRKMVTSVTDMNKHKVLTPNRV